VDLLIRHGEEITPTERDERAERSRLQVVQKHSIAEMRLFDIPGSSVARYRDDRLKVVQAAPVHRELVVLRHVFEVARREWSIPLRGNPVREIKLRDASKPRERRLEEIEAGKLVDAIDRRSAWYLWPLIGLAVETGMRRGELLSIRWRDVQLAARTARILKTRNGHPRTIPLTPKTIEILSSMERKDEQVFTVTPNAVRLAWEKLRKQLV
jgi:integrase